MSIAARRSHRGDEYQLRIALYWMNRIVLEDEWEWIRIDPVVIPDEIEKVLIDDIVIGHRDGTYRFIQAKKNQTDNRNWSISDLRDELIKARDELEKGPRGKIIFYSQTPFGDFKKFLNDAPDYETYEQFKHNASGTLKNILSALADAIDRDEKRTFHLFIHNVATGPHHTFEEWNRLIINDLKRFTHDPNSAFTILENLARKNQAGFSRTNQLTREDIISALEKSGLPLSPLKNEGQILEAFKEASRIGRNSIAREINHIKMVRKETNQIISALQKEKAKIVITGPPGTGKSWILAELADHLESENQYGVLYIKGDFFDDIDSENTLCSMLNLTDDIVGLAARLSSFKKPVVIIDSLDTLSIARDQKALKIFLSLLDRLSLVDRISIIVACRSFDLDYDPFLRDRKWDIRIYISNLDLVEHVFPLLLKWNLNPNNLPQDQLDLMRVPRNLKILERIVHKVPITSLISSYKFMDAFIEEIVIKNKCLANDALSALQDMASKLMDQRNLFLPKDQFHGNEEMVRILRSEGVLQEDIDRHRIAFTHQTLIDTLATRKAISQRMSLENFILSYPPMPFIRPAIRAFLFYLRLYDADRFSLQVKNVLNNPKIAYHIKRLIVESLAEIRPSVDDLNFFQWLLSHHFDFFRRFLERIEGPIWFDLLVPWLFEQIMADNSLNELKVYFIAKLRAWMNIRPKEIINYWNSFLDAGFTRINIILTSLDKFKRWETEGIYNLLNRLFSYDTGNIAGHLGKAISNYIQNQNRGDKLLWKFITLNIDENNLDKFKMDSHQGGLLCADHHFHNKSFLSTRICQSDYLLTKAIESIEKWSEKGIKYARITSYRNIFLRFTAWILRHEDNDPHSAGPLHCLLNTILGALSERSRKNDEWWRNNRKKLRSFKEAAIIYFLMNAYRENIKDNVPDIVLFLCKGDILLHEKLSYEIGELIHDAFPYLSSQVQEELQSRIQTLKSPFEEKEKEPITWLLDLKYQYLCNIPSYLRSPETIHFIEEWKHEFGEWPKPPHIYSWGGIIQAPISVEQMLSLSDETLLTLFKFYNNHDRAWYEQLNSVGGTGQVLSTFRGCCAGDPERFIPLFNKIVFGEIGNDYAISIMEGISSHLRYRFGNLNPPQDWTPPKPLPDGFVLAKTILEWIRRHRFIWKTGHEVADAIEACCHILEEPPDIELLIFFLFQLASHEDPEEVKQIYFAEGKEDIDEEDLDHVALNSVRGKAAKSAIVLALNLLENHKQLHELLFPLMCRFAKDPHIGVRVSILIYLPHFAQYDFKGAWELFRISFQDHHPLLWHRGERFLYYQYYNNFNKVAQYLDRIEKEAITTNGETWGRIATLAYLSDHVPKEQLFYKLAILNNKGAWCAAIQVFNANISHPVSRAKCLAGLLHIIDKIASMGDLLKRIDMAFEKLNIDNSEISLQIAEKFISAFTDINALCQLNWFYDWLCKLSNSDPFSALKIFENVLSKIEGSQSECYIWQGDKLVSSAMRILREADISDDHALISRAISLQDRLLKLELGNISHAMDEAARL